MNELDEIMSGDSNVMPEIQQEQQPEAGQQRDEHGRFAAPAKAEFTHTVTTTGGVEAVANEQPASEHQPNGVPVGAVQAEREKRQEAQKHASELERQLAELRGQVTLLTQQRQPAPQPQQEQQPATLWDDPDAYLRSQIDPLQTALLNQKAEFSKMIAVEKHGEDVFNAAESALEQAAPTPEGQAFIQKLRSSAHPAEDLIKWHKQQQSIARVGNDPDAWLNAEIEKRLSDPAFLAQAVERARTGAASNTNRAQPLTNLPPSLSRLPSGGNQPADTDMSDGALFSHATR